MPRESTKIFGHYEKTRLDSPCILRGRSSGRMIEREMHVAPRGNVFARLSEAEDCEPSYVSISEPASNTKQPLGTRALFTDSGVVEIRLVGKIQAFACYHSSREWIADVNSRSVQSQKLSLGLVFEEPCVLEG